ncbi:hypothetical protein EUTSA_v10011525mg [Eutrema salsugineum]|uniref:F-box domain-containing protein n=1 Tax=Eutrema salsugineum TaxID=72664 RepID=V4KJ63_EUTSA|nr:F-box/LRR-repeat protein At2g40920 [Eutrema salsugineum]ESQ29942.1 hypothetical protein EUTSA_v10011525mg [Eutrema salsugineum]
MGLAYRLSVTKRKRMKRRRKAETEIPKDVVMGEILTRLPVTSLMRFKCVSKLWSSLICSRYFCNRFLAVPLRPKPPRLYMCLHDCSDPRNSVTLSLAPDAASTSCFVVDHDLTTPRIGGYIWQNFRGFMCYTIWDKPRIYNPATRQLVTLPAAVKLKSNNREKSFKVVSYYFGHDPVKDQYKVVCSTGINYYYPNGVNLKRVISSEHRVFALKAGGGGSWKKAAPTPSNFLPHIPDVRGVCIDGVIYYLGWTDTYKSALVSFHIRSGDFKMIQVPRRDGDELPLRVINVTLIEYGGKATIFDQTNLQEKGILDLWAVADARNEIWSRKTLVLKPSQLHLVNNYTSFNIRGTTQNGKVFLIPWCLHSPFHILCYDLQTNDMRKIEIKGVPDHWFSKDKLTVNVTLMEQRESVMYLKT